MGPISAWMQEGGNSVTENAGFFCSRGCRVLTESEAEHKRAIYAAMSPRGRRFVDRMGYDVWDPFQEPKEPLDMRTDVTRRTTGQLVRLFLQGKDKAGSQYSQGALDCALGIVNNDERYRGIFEFCLWYDTLLRKEGHPAGHEKNV